MCKPLYASVIERCVTPPVGTYTWSVARKQSFRFVGGHVRNLTTSHFEREETKFVSNKTAIYRRIALLFVFSLSNSLFFGSFLRLSDLSHTQEQAGSMPLMQAVAPSPSHNRDRREKVRTFDKRIHRHKPFDLQRFVSVLWLRQAQLRDLVEVWALTGECSPPVCESSPTDQNRLSFFVQTFVNFDFSPPWCRKSRGAFCVKLP